MSQLLQHFLSDETGAITVDWVVLTAAVVALAIGIFSGYQQAVTEQRDKVSVKINQYRLDVQSYGGQ